MNEVKPKESGPRFKIIMEFFFFWEGFHHGNLYIHFSCHGNNINLKSPPGHNPIGIV